MIQPPEVQAKISILRQKAVEGTLSNDELKEAILLLRGSRRSAVASADAAKRAKAKKSVKSAEDMLKELEGL